MIAGQGRQFVCFEHADGVDRALFRAEQFANADAQRVGESPGNGNGWIGLVAFDLREHRFGDPGGTRKVVKGQAARLAQFLERGADFGRRLRGAGGGHEIACLV